MKWPILRQLSKYDLAKETMIGIIDIITPYVEAHESSLNPDDIRDFLDLMLVETKNRYLPLVFTADKLSLKHLIICVVQFFGFFNGFGRLLVSIFGDQGYHLIKDIVLHHFVFNIIISELLIKLSCYCKYGYMPNFSLAVSHFV